jgi:uncharacterized surface protein with fasciclin (FAS1) repeats
MAGTTTQEGVPPVLTNRWTRISAVAAAGLAAVSMAACSNSSGTKSDTGSGSSASSMPSASSSTMAATFGSACSKVPADAANPGSFQAMAQVPVATAASGNPLLSTLVTAVKKAGLVDTLNGLPAATVFAPSNDAFAALPKATLDKVLADKALLTKILTYHVVPGEKIGPDALAAKPLPTVEKGTVKVTGSGADFTVNGNAKVLCGNVQTSNATVYIIDHVLMPPA